MSVSRFNENKNLAFRDAEEKFDDFFEGRNEDNNQVIDVPFSHKNLSRNTENQKVQKASNKETAIQHPHDFMQNQMNSMFSSFGDLMKPMTDFSKFDDLSKLPDNPNSHSFYHSSVQHFDEEGKKYEKTHTLNKGPGGVKEERKTETKRDEELKRMSLGQYINERGVETEKTKRGRGPIETKRTLHKIGTEEEVKKFENEWRGASSGLLNIGMGNGRRDGRSNRRIKN